MFKGTLIDLLVGVYTSEITPVQAQKVIHIFFGDAGLNPTMYEPLSALLQTANGKEKISRYEKLMNEMNWLIARLSSQEIDVDASLVIMEEEMNRYLNGENDCQAIV